MSNTPPIVGEELRLLSDARDRLRRAAGRTYASEAEILEELQHDGIVVSVTNTQRKTFWSLKGINPGQKRHQR